MEDKTTSGGLTTPSDSDISRMIQEEVARWAPRRGPDWPDILIRLAGVGPAPWVVYSVASATLVVILFAAFLVGSALQLGGLATQTVTTHLP